MNPRGYIEPFLGAGAVLLALLDPALVPGWGYMGGKRKHAYRILASLGRRPGEGAREIILSEAGPLGWVWSEICAGRERAGAVAEAIERWRGLESRRQWRELLEAPIPTSPAERAAAVVYLQAGSAKGRALQVRDGRWHAQGFAHLSNSAREKGFRERILAEQIARRIRAIADALSRLPVRFIHGDASEAIPAGDLSGFDIYWDPPYQGATSYAADCPRARLLALVRDAHARGATNTVSEAVPLPIDGWRHVEITRPGGKPEFLTCSRWPAKSWRVAA